LRSVPLTVGECLPLLVGHALELGMHPVPIRVRIKEPRVASSHGCTSPTGTARAVPVLAFFATYSEDQG
jgi:hypothetical protein